VVSKGVRSMTGYGRGVAEREGRRVSVEIRSVNHRFFDLKLRGAVVDPAVEDRVGSRLRQRIERGALSVTLRLEGGATGATVRVDRDAARRVHQELDRLGGELRVPGPGPGWLALLCAVPGVLIPAEPSADPDLLAAQAEQAVDRAVDELLVMRSTEGASLSRDLLARLARLGELAGQIEALAGAAPADARRRLHDRLERLLQGSGVAVDEARLAQEVAVLADRQDVTEELVRLRSHLEQAAALIAADGAVGRRLDFLVQELGREINTIGAKSQASAIARVVVDAKAELEKVREQVQNVE
jgi:uncharacterized protein (TIGR00255 family)